MAARRVTSSIVACLCVIVAGLAFAGVSAPAAVTHDYLSQLTGFGNPTAIGFDASGDIYVVDTGAKTVDRFSSAGTPLAFSASGSYIEGSKLTGDPTGSGGSFVAFEEPHGIAVNDENGDIYVSDGARHVVDVFSSTGRYLSQITEVPASSGAPVHGAFQDPYGLAVDQSTHDLYVTDPHSEVVDVFSSTGAYVSQFGAGVLGGSFGESVAVNDLTEDSYVADSGCDCVDVFGSGDSLVPPGWHGASTPQQSFGGGYVYVGLDPTTDHVYVAATTPDVVDEFTSSGSEEYIDQLTGTPTGENGSLVPFGTPQAVAASSVGGDLYVADSSGVVDVFSSDIKIPATAVRPPTSVSKTTATVSGTVNPEGVQVTSCEFEYGTSISYGQTAPCEQSPAHIGAGTVPVTVTAELTGLQPNTTYHYRLKAATEGSSTSGDATLGPPIVGVQSVSNVSASSASFQAQVDPGGAETTYSFEYGTSSAYGASVPLPAGTISAGSAGPAEAHAQGLLANTTYHYRVVAVNALGAVAGRDQTFTTQTIGSPLQLPDGRAWEMVSPPQKEGARFGWILEDIIQASANGNAFTDWTFFQPSGKAEGSDNLDTTFFGRGPDGWSSRVITPPHNQATGVSIGQGNEYPFFSEDLSKSVMKPFGGFMALSPEATEPTAYVRSDYLNGNPSEACTSDCYQPLVTATNVPSETKFGEYSNGECKYGRIECGPEFVDGTPDLDHIVLSSPVALTPGSKGGLYEWTAGQLTSIGSGELGTGGGESNPDQRHAISNDGTRVIFDNYYSYYEPSEGLRGLLMRDTATGKTVRIDAPNTDVPSGQGEGEASYMTAGSDDSRIFFLDVPGLTLESSTGGPDLYEYNLNAPAGSRLTDLSVDKSAPEPAEVQMVIGASEDGSYVYFVARGALAQGARPGNNLYMSHDGVVKLIAELSSEDPDSSTSLQNMGARVSPNGRWLAFMSNRELTGYDTVDAFSGHPDEEVYLYDASSNKLVCASCNPTGARPVGVEYNENPGIVGATTGFMAPGTWVAANVPPWTKYKLGAALYQSRYLSNSGRLFFDSNDALAPQDVNGTQDVYEYEPDDYENAEGKRECSEESSTFSERLDGCVGLISSGASNEESAFLDASETGGDVFFLTSAKLLPQDFDNAPDIYDARECVAASPCASPPPVPPPPCDTGDSCKPAQSAQPTIFGPAPSATFSGAGNVVAQGSQQAASTRSLTRAQKLARALRACRRIKGKQRRLACRRRARSSFGTRAARKAGKSRPSPRPAGQGAEKGSRG